MLCCPKCKEKLIKDTGSYTCTKHHRYDIAKRGYVNLLLGNHGVSGDDKDMIRSRTRFLSHGYYQPLCDALKKQLTLLHPSVLIDAGCGEGFYTNQIKNELPDCDIYGFDLSKFGVDEASKAHNGITYAVANVFHLPIVDACADALLSIFAPFDLDEINRVLKKGGAFIKVAPAQQHLLDLKRVVYEEVYENTLSPLHDERFEKVAEQLLAYEIQVESQEDIHALFQMTPYYWKSPKEGSERLASLDHLQTRVHFHIEVYLKK